MFIKKVKKNKKKGFTLIELLAVILILGVIALIAIPSVNNVIEQSRKGAAETSAENYIGSVNSKIITSKLDTDKTNDLNDGFVSVSSLDVELSGKSPEDGTILIKNGKVDGATFTLNGYDILCDSDGRCTAEKEVQKYAYFATIQESGAPDVTYEDTISVRPIEKRVYFKFPVVNNTLGRAEACAFYEGRELCLYNSEYDISKQKMKDFFKFDETTWVEDPSYKEMDSRIVKAYVNPNSTDHDVCYSRTDGLFLCGNKVINIMIMSRGNVYVDNYTVMPPYGCIIYASGVYKYLQSY